MPLQPISVPSNNNHFFSAFCLGLILPVSNNDEEFDLKIEHLFGKTTSKVSANLRQELENYTTTVLPASLNNLINTKLRSKLVEYIKEHRREFMGFFASEHEFESRIALTRQADTPSDELEIRALAAMVGVRISLHNELFISGLISNASLSTQRELHLTFVKGTYYYFIDTDALSEELRHRLLPFKANIPEKVDINKFQRAKAKLLLQHMFDEAPVHITTISQYVNTRTKTNNFNPVNEKLALRDDARHELSVMRPAMNRVQLSEPYDIELQSSLAPMEPLKDRVLYVEIDTHEFRYVTKDISDIKKLGATPRDSIQYDELDLNFPVTIEQLRLCLPKILEITEEREHSVPIINVEIGSDRYWYTPGTGFMYRSAYAGVASGLSTVGAVTLIGELTGVGLGLAAATPIGVPLAIGTFLTTMGLLVLGNRFAIAYKKAIDRVNLLLSEERFDEAVAVLDAEFNRQTYGIRDPLLLHQHHVIAHYFRAICAKEIHKYPEAYIHYHESSKAAVRAGIKDAVFILKLQLLALLKNSSNDAYLQYQEDYKVYKRKTKPVTTFISDIQSWYTGKKDSEELQLQGQVDNIIQTLTSDFNPELTNFCRTLLERIQSVSIRFNSFKALSIEEIQLANDFLLVNSFYLLKYYGTGFGAFSEVISVFFKGAILGFFDHMDPTYLKEATNIALVSGLPEKNERRTLSANALTLEILKQAAHLLLIFKRTNKITIQKFPVILPVIRFIETFILKFSAVWINTEKYTLEDYHQLALSLQDEVQQVDLSTSSSHPRSRLKSRTSQLPPLDAELILQEIQTSIHFLADLEHHFGLFYETEERWIEDLLAEPSQIAYLISESTGDTMLHVLVKLQSGSPAMIKLIKLAAEHLKPLYHVRNFKNETPIVLLERVDPYELKAILCPDPLIKTGNEIDKVLDFLNRIKNNPAIDGHFLLLDGPPGTGKTDIVTNQLKSMGYPIKEWVRGTSDDKYPNGTVERIEKFFSKSAGMARGDTVLIMFIDEIHGIIPIIEGTVSNGHHNSEADVTAFLTQITAMKGHRVVLIGATNYPNLLPKPILSRAGVNRINFPLPNIEQRQQLLNHFFRAKRIESSSIKTLANVSVGYAPRDLGLFVASIKETVVTFDMVKDYFNQYAKILRDDFKESFGGHAEIFMPSFESEGELGALFTSNDELEEQLRRLKDDTSCYANKHTVLYGPPGGGKTTAVRIFAQTSGKILISVDADQYTKQEILRKIFARAKQLGPVIIFFDEMDRVANKGSGSQVASPHTKFLQTEMSGILANDITVIGATNWLDRFEPAIISRFSKKILLPTLGATELNKPVKKILLESIAQYKKSYTGDVYFDQELAQEMEDGATRLGHEASTLDLRSINAAICYLMGDLQRANKTLAGITYLRLQDVCFSIFIKKIEEGMVPRPFTGLQTSTQYIYANKLSFFPSAVPFGSTLAPNVSMSI